MAFAIPNRPFATEPITGLMLPDGIFEASIGNQTINTHVSNTGAAAANVQVYVESVSDPGIVVTPATHFLANAAAGVAHLFGWQANFSAATPGAHLISFIVETPAGDQRILKKIWVTKLGYNPADGSFSATVPEGVMSVQVKDVIRPKDGGRCRCRPQKDPCGCDGKDDERRPSNTDTSVPARGRSDVKNENVLDYLVEGFKGHDPNFTFCPPWYLPKEIHASIKPTPAYTGQYGDLPFTDPAWWKVVLCIIAALLALAAAIAEAVDGSGEVTVSGGTGGSTDEDCCGVEASGGGTSYVAAGLLAAAGTVATIGVASDERDIIRKGADNTAPANAGEVTLQEELDLVYHYIEPIEFGKPFKIKGDWKYTRTTNMSTYTHAATETHANVHLLSKYEINAPDTLLVYKREMFVIEARFFDADDKLFKGDQLFVQCFLIGPNGQWRKIVLQDNGMPLNADAKANDGTYTGRHFFSTQDKGLWTYFVIAQDINTAQPDMKPEEAAQIIGGMVLTNQLTITFDGGTCSFVPDGHVNVIS